MAEASAPLTTQESTRSRFGNDPGRWVVVATVGLTVLGVLSMISPSLIFTPTLATVGDLGAHVYPLREFVDRLVEDRHVLELGQEHEVGLAVAGILNGHHLVRDDVAGLLLLFEKCPPNL